MTVPASVYKLVEEFQRNEKSYKRPDYNETQLRISFINPLFAALGWNIADITQVSHEDRVMVEGKPKRPDYGFRVHGTTRFFLETKKPSLNLKDDPSPAYQLRRYGWSGNLPVSVLSDFEEFTIYDCRIQPRRYDPADTGRLRYYTYPDYVDNWDKLYALFSREAVADGALRDWIGDSKTRGALTVDQAFLREMESWREALAKDIALRNDLTQRQLNHVVQRSIDRIVFLRIAEDRGIESYGRLRSIAGAGRSVYAGLKQLFIEADDKYNSGLFHFGEERRASQPDALSLNIDLGDEALREIINKLYYPNSPYEFSVLPADILGQVYERFLGKVIELSPGGAAQVTDKPEVRKAGGVYYTPTYIVDYIVENTVGKLLEGATPAEAAELRILDPACGSGSFLTGAYQYLLDWHLEYYRQRPAQFRNRRRETADGMILTTAEKRRILLNSIYGVDLDQNAVEVSKLSLLLKMLEDENEATGRQTLMFAAGGRILPDLSDNIKWGNSLIGSDFYSGKQMGIFGAEEVLKVKPFDWDSKTTGFGEVMARGGFDAVIGNPPYVRIQTMKETAPETVPYYKKNYVSASKGNYDIYVVFVEKGLKLLNERGLLGFILPHKFFNAKYGEPLRGLVSSGNHLRNIVHFGDQQVFDGATTYTCLLFLNKQPRPRFRFASVANLNSWKSNGDSKSGIVENSNVTSKSWIFLVGDDLAVYEKLNAFELRLGHVADRIFQGLKTGSDKFYIVEKIADNGATIVVHSRHDDEIHELENELLHTLIKGGDSHKYLIDDTVRLILFPYSQDGRLLLESEVRHKYPLTWNYLEKHEGFLRSREHRKMDTETGWYAYTRNQALDVISHPKIFVPDISKTASYSLDKSGDMFFTGGTAGGYGIVPSAAVTSDYLLALLNSRLLNWQLRNISTSMRGGWYSYESRYIAQLPIRTIDFDKPADVARHDSMVALVDAMLDLHKQLPGLAGPQRAVVQAQIEATDRAIDGLVYELYGLSDEEIAIVEG